MYRTMSRVRRRTILGGNMDFNNLDPNEKLALILYNRKNIKRMRDDMIAIVIGMAVLSIALFGLGFALYEIKSALGINIFP